MEGLVRASVLTAAVGTLVFVAACGGNAFTTATGTDGGSDGGVAGIGGEGTGGDASGGRTGTGGRSTGGRIGSGGRATGGYPGAGGFTGAGGLIGPGGIAATGGLAGTGGGFCNGGDCSYLDDACNKGTCLGDICGPVPVPDGNPCEDGSLCTSGDTCKSGACVAGAGLACAAPGQCMTATCDPSTGHCVSKPVPDGGGCYDGNNCTTGDICTGGACSGRPVGCVNGDGCCPVNCSPTADSDCSGCTNIALKAVASSSGGGSGTIGPQNMNDGVGKSSCAFTWVFDDVQPSGAWIEFSWTDAVTIGSMYVETEPASGQPPVCSTVATRNLASGRVQYLSGGAWYDIASFTGFVNDVQVNLTNPVTTTAIRIFDMTATSPGYNSVIYEWHVYPQLGCKPPP
jgi:hypothetical protein